jgi:hypothetical protein
VSDLLLRAKFANRLLVSVAHGLMERLRQEQLTKQKSLERSLKEYLPFDLHN